MLVLGKYKFVFGFGFLKEINKKFSPIKAGSITIKIGMENVMSIIMSGDVEGLVELLKLANKTEKDITTEAEIAEFVADYEDVDQLFDEVLDELKTSNFTKKKALEFLGNLEKQEKKNLEKQAK